MNIAATYQVRAKACLILVVHAMRFIHSMDSERGHRRWLAARNVQPMRPRRLANISYKGRAIYFLTLCSFARRECFTDGGFVDIVRVQFVKAADAYDFELVAYCFMPDHLHLLVEGTTARSDLRAFVADAKRGAAHAARSWIRGRLWQPGYFDRVLRDRDDAHTFVKYIVENPMRAGMARRQDVFPFIGGTRVSAV